MKFNPRAPREGINVSKEHPLTEAATLIVGLSALFVVIVAIVVFFVDFVVFFVAPKNEARWLQNWVTSDFLPADYDGDRARELQTLVDRLSGHWPENPYPFRVGIISSDEPNALALPGGVILVTEALVDGAESENEIAFVLGHEIGHFKNRDHLRHLGRGVVFGLILVAVSGQDAGLLGSNVIDLTSRSFNRTQESEADTFGLGLVYKEYGHVAESWRFFERAAEQSGTLDSFANFLATHPSSNDRIAEIKKAAMRNGWALEGSVTPFTG